MVDILNIFTYFQDEGIFLIFKTLLLVLIFVYIIFSFIVFNRIRALNRTVYITGGKASATLQFISLISLFAALSLFIATLVIV